MKNGYQIYYYKNQKGKIPAQEYISHLPVREKAKIKKYLDFLGKHNGCLPQPLCKHIFKEIRELRVDFSRNRHRIFYFIFSGQRIILLNGFQKHTEKTPRQEINYALNNIKDFKLNQSFVQYEQ